MKHTSSCPIHKVEITNDILCGRGGITFFVKYIERIGILSLLLEPFKKLKKSSKGLAVEQFLKQILCYFFDGTSRHLTYYDDLAKDEGYAAALGNRSDEMVSSHAVKRFFRAFGHPARFAFTKILHQMFLWRLQQRKPDQIVLTIDTMVLDNDEAQHREGCDPTYKKVKGFQPLQVIWEGKIVDAIFRRGKRHSNYGGQHFKMLQKLVMFIRTNYSWTVPIIVRMDSGFLDEELYVSLEALSVGFIGSGKTYKATREKVGQLPEKAWKKYDNGRQCWKYASFEYKCDSWQTDYRALYTTPMYEDQQQVLEFVRPDNIIFTNLEEGTSIWDVLSPEQRKEWSRDDTLIASHHQRGADELPHRGLKDFAEEQLPFQNYASNQAYYYLMLIAFFLFECFKEDGLQDVLPTTSYARTIRRKFLDIAAKIVVSGRERVIKVSQAVMERLRLDEVLKRCQMAPIIQRI